MKVWAGLHDQAGTYYGHSAQRRGDQREGDQAKGEELLLQATTVERGGEKAKNMQGITAAEQDHSCGEMGEEEVVQGNSGFWSEQLASYGGITN